MIEPLENTGTQPGKVVPDHVKTQGKTVMLEPRREILQIRSS